MTFKVVVAGGGLAGALLANGLLNNNIDFVVYEADARDSDREGYQIRLGAPALAGFRACLTQQRQDELFPKFGRSGGMISSAPILYDTHLNLLLDLTKFPAYTKSAPISREILRQFLVEPIDAAGKIHYGRKLKSYEVDGSSGNETGSKVTVVFEDGTKDECDLLIGAEGSRSEVLYSLSPIPLRSY